MFLIDLDTNNGRMRNVIYRDAAKCYRDWKSDLHDYFKSRGGVDNPNIRLLPPPNLRDRAHWPPMCDVFRSERFQVDMDLI